MAFCFDVAFHVVMRTADRICDALYRVDTRREDQQRPGDKAATRHRDPASNMPSYYLRLLALRRHMKPGTDDVVADLGCGTGRVLFVFNAAGAGTCRGVEFHPELCAQARANARRSGTEQTVEVVERDVADYRFRDETIVYLFNPFGPGTLTAVLKNLRASLYEQPRRVRIAYYHPRHRHLLDGCKWLERTGTVRGFKTDIAIYETRD